MIKKYLNELIIIINTNDVHSMSSDYIRTSLKTCECEGRFKLKETNEKKKKKWRQG